MLEKTICPEQLIFNVSGHICNNTNIDRDITQCLAFILN